jgi:hypothetical protein
MRPSYRDKPAERVDEGGAGAARSCSGRSSNAPIVELINIYPQVDHHARP